MRGHGRDMAPAETMEKHAAMVREALADID
jgi:hypothetical protein